MTGLKSLLSDDLLQERREREPIVMFVDECSLFKKVQCIAEALLGPTLALPLNPKLCEFFLERIEWERCKEERQDAYQILVKGWKLLEYREKFYLFGLVLFKHGVVLTL